MCKLLKVYGLVLLVLTTTFLSCTMEEETVIIPRTLDQYKSELLQFVNAQIVVVDNCVVGFNRGDFRSAANFVAFTTAYRTQLTAALATLNNPNLTIADVVLANSSLTAAGRNFQTNLFISDRRPLNDVIVECEALDSATPEGTGVGQAPPSAKAAFAASIAAARIVRNATTTIERQVSEEVVKLNAARQVFLNAIVK